MSRRRREPWRPLSEQRRLAYERHLESVGAAKRVVARLLSEEPDEYAVTTNLDRTIARAAALLEVDRGWDADRALAAVINAVREQAQRGAAIDWPPSDVLDPS